MKTRAKFKQSSMQTVDCIIQEEGETIEEKIARVKNNKDGISEGADAIYTERNEGVIWETNVRSDRWSRAIEARDAQTKTYRAKRAEATKTAAEGPTDGPPETPKNQPGGRTGDPSQ